MRTSASSRRAAARCAAVASALAMPTDSRGPSKASQPGCSRGRASMGVSLVDSISSVCGSWSCSCSASLAWSSAWKLTPLPPRRDATTDQERSAVTACSTPTASTSVGVASTTRTPPPAASANRNAEREIRERVPQSNGGWCGFEHHLLYAWASKRRWRPLSGAPRACAEANVLRHEVARLRLPRR